MADLFAGIGGFHLAFHQAGAECVFASEWDRFARQTYKKNLSKIAPDLFLRGNFAEDITTVDPSSIPDCDIVTGGFPCQSFSQVGKKAGFSDPRGNLFFTIAEIIRAKQPAAFCLENVRHLLSHDSGETFGVIRRTVEQDLGYSFYHKVIRGTDFNIPQHRPRVFMVGFRKPSTPFAFPSPIPLKLTMSDVLGGKCSRRVGYTLRVGGRGCDIADRRNWDSYMVEDRVVRIGPAEGKAMMGLPKHFEFPVSDSQAMKQLGNSVAVPVVRALAKSVIFSLESSP